MEYTNYTTDSRKHKHLNIQERTIIELRIKDGCSAYKIAKELHRPINIILNEIRRGTVPQIKNKRKKCQMDGTFFVTIFYVPKKSRPYCPTCKTNFCYCGIKLPILGILILV